MQHESRSRLETVLDRHEREIATQVVQQPPSEGEVQFAVAFERVREGILLPTLREFAALLENRGQPCEVIEEPHPGHHLELATVGLRLLPPDSRHALLAACPTVLFTPDPARERVVVLVNARHGKEDESGANPEYGLDRMTAAAVEAEVLNLVEEALPVQACVPTTV